ncbi:uncharacterized protein LOC111331022 [Stylophora pistillata]|uniref:uncharacterized protein LOC111331022 n=1 Tax=Stylophora pistillata TaxID=50429 RepID=UPI000C048EB9|nr:uncharacterized protein LOC111331022 [Stylophora pistillata]
MSKERCSKGGMCGAKPSFVSQYFQVHQTGDGSNKTTYGYRTGQPSHKQRTLVTNSSDVDVKHHAEEGGYDDSVEPVPTEEEAAVYLEQLALEEEEEQILLSRFSGEEDIGDWCKCTDCSTGRPDKRRVWLFIRNIKETIALAMSCTLWKETNPDVDKERKSYGPSASLFISHKAWFMQSVAYHQFVRLVYEYVGASRRVPLPNCVYNSIREAFPNVDSEYKGYEEEEI